jgi:TonB family protein
MQRDVLIALSVLCAVFMAGAPAAAQQDLRLTGQYPEAALEQGLGGTVGLECTVLEDGAADCAIMSEMPGGMGFGDAAIAMSREWRLQVEEDNDLSAPGTQLRRAVFFEPGPTPSIRSTPGRVELPWERRPSALEFTDYLPSRVFDRRINGEAVVDCIVNAERELDCQVVSESPSGEGFGRAALQFAGRYRIAPQMPTGESTIGGRVRIPIRLNVRGR